MTIDLKHLRALAEAATPGPWTKLICDVGADDIERIVATTDGEFSPLGMHECQANAAFIAAARTAVPELLDEVVRLRAKLDEVTNGDFEAWCDKLVASRVANAQHAYDRVVAERDNARTNARILAHSYTHDSRPPQRAVDEALAYPARPEAK